MRISYSGASLAGIFGEIAELPLTLAHPPRSLGVLQSGTMPPSPAALQLKMHILGEFSALRGRMEKDR